MGSFRGLKGSGISAKNPANKEPEMIVRNPLTGRKDVRDDRTVGGDSRSSVNVDSSATHSTSSWSDGDIVELLHDTLPANVGGTSCAFGHVLGADRSEAEVRGVRVRQLLTAAQVPAVLMITCFFRRWCGRLGTSDADAASGIRPNGFCRLEAMDQLLCLRHRSF